MKALNFDESTSFSETMIQERQGADLKFDAVLDWELGEKMKSVHDYPEEAVIYQNRRHRLSSSGKALDRFHRDLLFAQLPENARMLVRISLRSGIDFDDEHGGLRPLAGEIRDFWDGWIADQARHGKLQVTLVATPTRLVNELKIAAGRVAISWSNFHGPKTPPEQVLYYINGEYVGRGNIGFDRILSKLDQLPENTEVRVPKYEYRSRWAVETFSKQELEHRNTELRDAVPFQSRVQELNARIAQKLLRMESYNISLKGRDPITVMDWDSGDEYGQAFVSFGRIVRYDERRSSPTVRLGWTRYQTREHDEQNNRIRQVEDEAFYTLDDVELGQGVDGFALCMEKLAVLPEGSVVHVPVNIRTRGPFVCPIIFEGHRHFERTGFEPYVGMFPWLIDVARKHHLVIEWIPDEQKSCGDCIIR